MPLARGASRRVLRHNVGVEVGAGMDRSRATAVAYGEARRTARRRSIATGGDLSGVHVVELNEVLTPELGRWYEAVWRVRGRTRAHRREQGPKLGPVRAAFRRFVSEACRSIIGSGR